MTRDKTINKTHTRRPPLRVISLYTGAGGLDLGFEAAGFNTAVAVEFDKDCATTLRANRNWPVIERSIHDVSSDEILEVGKLDKGEADVLIGGPPCQPFSKSSYWVRGDSLRLDDPRADTLAAYMRVLRDTQPKAFLLENVHGLAFKGKDEGLRLLLDVADRINKDCGTNYRISWKVLQAAAYGVPQRRERVFLIGHRDGILFEFPEGKFENPDKNNGQLSVFNCEPYRNTWDAIGDLPEPENDHKAHGKWGDLLPSIPEGHNYLWHTNRHGGRPLFGWRTRYWSFLLKLAKNKPSWTIQAQPGSAIGPFHWNNRRLTVRELCRLQTFPDDFQIIGGRTTAQRQLGNAVPSLLGEVLALEIRRLLLDRPARKKVPSLLQSVRQPVPEPEPILPVPSKYHIYIGDQRQLDADEGVNQEVQGQ